MGGWDFRCALRAGVIVAAIISLGGCSGGVPSISLPELPSLSSNAAEGEGAPAEGADAEKVDLAELAKAGPLGDKTLGKENAPVTIVEYASLTCPHCAKFHAETFPQLKKAYIDTGKVRYIFREFPIGRSAAAAAIAVRCAPEKAFFTLNEKLLASQSKWVSQEVKHDEIYAIIKTSGLKRDKYNSCATDQAINDALYEVKMRGRSLGVAGTPTFFINGKKARGALSFEEISKLIEEAQPQSPPLQQAQAQASPA